VSENPARRSLTRFAWLSIAAALATMALKSLAWYVTGSVGLLSDALESLVNLGGASMALWMLWLAAQPPDHEHAYGHDKAEYFASGFEGMLIFVAGGAIAWAALPRLWQPQPLEQTGLGLAVAALAAVINLVVARVLLRAGGLYRSPTLTADARHLMTDVWTSVGVIGGVGLVHFTGWLRLDPLLALAVAANILWTGYRLVREAAMGLMDTAWPEILQAELRGVLDGFRARGIEFHAVRTRGAAARHFVSMHVLVPGDWTVQRGHDLLEELEEALAARIPRLTAYTHLEPIEDAASYRDIELERHG
jgi:cation diffusion facilitator family transporter